MARGYYIPDATFTLDFGDQHWFRIPSLRLRRIELHARRLRRRRNCPGDLKAPPALATQLDE
jgi:hypothetical protein